MKKVINRLRTRKRELEQRRNEKLEVFISGVAKKIGLRKKIIILNKLCRKHPRYMSICTLSIVLFLGVSGFVHDVLSQQEQNNMSQTELRDMDISYMFDTMHHIQDMKKVEKKEILSKNAEILNTKKEVELLLAKKDKSYNDSIQLQKKYRNLKILLND